MLADAHLRRAASNCSRGSHGSCHAPRMIISSRHWLGPCGPMPATFAAPRRGRGNSSPIGVAPDQGVYSAGSSEDTLELAATKTNLREALQKIDVLTQQVAIVDELQTQMIEQDELIAELEQLIESDKRKQDNEREVLNGQLAAVQGRLDATASELEGAQSKLSSMPDIKHLQGEVARLREVEAELEGAQAQLERLSELEALQEQQQVLQAQLQEQGLTSAQLTRDLETAREQLALAQGAATTARVDAQEAQDALSRKVEELAAIEADVENMRKTMNKGGKKARTPKVPPAKGAKGFASPAVPAPLVVAKVPAGAENHLREELKQAQSELEQLQGTLDEREAQLQAAQSAVEFLTSQCKEQELHMTAVQAQLDATSLELESRKASEMALQQEVASLTVRLSAEANDKASAISTLKEQLEAESRERLAVAAQRDALAAECAGLRGSIGDLEDRRHLQDMAVGELDESLQELRVEVETAQQLKLDLAILAEAFSSKEAELEAVQGRLLISEDREADLQEQVAQAEDSLSILKTMLAELQSTNTDLGDRFEALAVSFRATGEQRAEAEARATEAARQLAESREQAAGLREQLGANTKALSETAQALSEAQAAEASQRMAAQTLSERLAAEQAAVIKQTRDVEALREQVVMLNEQIAFLSASEGSVKKLQEALRRSDGELASLRSELALAQGTAQAADRGKADMERLQRELTAVSSALAGKESALALARRAAEATDAEMRGAKRQVEAANNEVATMRTQVALLSGELTAVRQERDAASRAEVESIRELQQELSAEAEATLELLNKAESLVLASSAADRATVSNTADVNNVLLQARNDLDVQTELWESERQRSAALEREVTALSEQLRNAALGRRLGAGDDSHAAAGTMSGTLAAAFLSARGSPREMEAANVKLLEELNASKDGALSARAEAEALQTRVEYLERELRARDALITDLRSSGISRGNRQGDTLVQQLKSLQEENTKLKQAAARQQQLLNQTKLFFEKKIGPSSDLTVAGARAPGGSNNSSPSRNGV